MVRFNQHFLTSSAGRIFPRSGDRSTGSQIARPRQGKNRQIGAKIRRVSRQEKNLRLKSRPDPPTPEPGDPEPDKPPIGDPPGPY